MAETQNQNKEKQQDLGQLLKVRREKLSALQEADKDPFYTLPCLLLSSISSPNWEMMG